MKKIIKLTTFLMFTLLLTACGTKNMLRGNNAISVPRDYELTILFTGNTNGKINSTTTGHSYSKLSTLLSQAKNLSGVSEVMYLDGGNTFYSNNPSNLDQGKAVAKSLNAAKLTATTLGSNDFNYGVENVKAIEMRSNFEILAGNVKKENGQDFTTEYIIREINGVKVGIFGLVSPDLYNVNEKISNKIIIEEPIVSANKIVKKLKASGVDCIIALTHLGMDSIHKEWEVASVAESVSGIDLILDGDSIDPFEEKLIINNTPIIQVGENFENIGVIRIDFDAPKRDRNKVLYKLIKNKNIDIPKTNYPKDDATSIQEVVSDQLAGKFITHTVVKGDTLYSLAKKYNTTVDAIVKINPEITDGQTISIGKTYNMNINKSAITSVKKAKYINYTVVKGDTLYSLARKYNTTVDAIVKINPEIADGQNIKIGVTYKIPKR